MFFFFWFLTSHRVPICIQSEEVAHNTASRSNCATEFLRDFVHFFVTSTAKRGKKHLIVFMRRCGAHAPHDDWCAPLIRARGAPLLVGRFWKKKRNFDAKLGPRDGEATNDARGRFLGNQKKKQNTKRT